MATRKPTPTNILDELMPTTMVDPVSRETRIHRIALDRIVDNPFQYRQHYGPEGLRDLATNIASLAWQLPATSGLQQVPMARLMYRSAAGALTPVDAVTYERPHIIDNLLRTGDAVAQLAYGHRRLRAFEVLANGPDAIDPRGKFDWPRPEPTEFGTLPITVMFLDDQAMAEFALTENSQREDVSAIEEATLLQRMIDELGISIEDVGRKFGWSRSTTSNKLRLLKLPERVRQHVLRGDLTEKHARTLLRLDQAPALLATTADKCRSESWTTKRLDDKITEAICNLPAVPDGRVDMATNWGTRQADPPWDLSWATDTLVACIGCPSRITFGAELGPRCINADCHRDKGVAWKIEDANRQRAAARIALDSLHGGDTLLDVLAGERRRIEIVEKPVMWQTKRIRPFSTSNSAEKELIDGEQCGPHCECFAACVVDNMYSLTGYWRPAPETAPNVVYCCTNPAHAEEKIALLRPSAEAAREAQRKAEYEQRLANDEEFRKREEQRRLSDEKEAAKQTDNRRQAEALVAGAVERIGGIDALWSNQAFLVDVAWRMASYPSDQDRSKLGTLSVADLRVVIARRALADTSRNGMYYELSGVQSACNRIAPPPAQPGPGQSQTTQWQDGWTDVDESAYEDIVGGWSGSWATLQAAMAGCEATVRVLLRLIEACPDKAVRSDLWRMHNSMAVPA